MSEEELFNNDENMFLHQVENFYTAWGLVKICAQKCNLFKAGAGNTLTDNDSKCLSITNPLFIKTHLFRYLRQ